MATALEVKTLLAADYDTVNNPSLVPAIAAANLMMARAVACAAAKNKPLTSDEQAEITKWLAAHFYCQQDRQYTSRSTGGASGSWGMAPMTQGLGSSTYGQTAMTLDPSGCLAAQDKRNTARGFSMGVDDVS